ncbi:glycosyltransferase family 2 protein [Paraconexibacter sp.]|uniref:glycosyltransferase family 2 protein n=1 Tax=Paraconexibacter sp. TaxID=2949640 RepID=UPI003569C944
MSFSVVIVLHDSAPDLGRLLRSLESHLDVTPQLICVDSGSDDDGAGVDLARAHGAEVVELPDNPGFGAANNAGVALARHDVTVLLNPDVVVLDPVALPALVAEAAIADALHVPRLLNADGTVQDSAHPLPGSLGQALLAVSHPPRLPRVLRDLAQPWRSGRTTEVGWAIAACVAARTATLRGLGPFDPSAFLFFEDLDLCLRARERGVRTVLHPDLALRHTGGHSTGPAFGGEPYELLARRRRAVVLAGMGVAAARRDDLLEALTFSTRILAARLTGRPADTERARLAALRAARRG